MKPATHSGAFVGTGVLTCLALGTVFAALLGAEILTADDMNAARSPVPPRQAMPPVAGARNPGVPGPGVFAPGAFSPGALADRADRLLERPLFSADRRMPAAKEGPEPGAAPGAVFDGLPRLSGIVVGPAVRHAIFTDPNGKPVRVSIGAAIGRFTVRAIEPGQVTVIGTEGEQVLHPTFAKTTEQRAPVAAPRFGQ